MALGTLVLTSDEIKGPNDSLQILIVAFPGDTSMAAGGTAGFKAYIQAIAKRAVKPLYVVPVGGCGGYVPRYDLANDKFQVFQSAGSAAALAEVTTGDLSGTTFKLAVVCV
jgi:hypothetical protein